MAEQHTYLELSEAGGGSHKFYEVEVAGHTVTVRFGRIGDGGQTKVSEHPSEEKALGDAQRKIQEKVKKGYVPAVRGGRQKRSVTRRQLTSGRSDATQAPVLWRFATGERAFGLFVDARRCWVGNERGALHALDHEGRLLAQLRLPEGVKCIVSDGRWLYAGCDDGNVYDLSGKLPRVAWAVSRDVDLFWLDIQDGLLGVSDALGQLTAIDHEDESQWTRQSAGNAGWMVRCDAAGMYHGHARGVTHYDAQGREVWSRPTKGPVLFGWQEASGLYACTSMGFVHRFSKDGAVGPELQCDSAVFSVAAVDDGRLVFAGDDMSSVYCFNARGERLWKLSTGCGSAFSMQSFEERLYLVTTDGVLACLDVSEAAVRAARGGRLPQARSLQAPQPVEALPSHAVETTREADAGVVVECYEAGGALRVRVVSPGFREDWHVQFPKELRQAGARYVVEGVHPSARGGFYRAHGDIRRLVR